MSRQSQAGMEAMEAWGRCASCDRWFYCGPAEAAVESTACPVCVAPADQVELRLVDAST
jgi:hypothetical protein